VAYEPYEVAYEAYEAYVTRRGRAPQKGPRKFGKKEKNERIFAGSRAEGGGAPQKGPGKFGKNGKKKEYSREVGRRGAELPRKGPGNSERMKKRKNIRENIAVAVPKGCYVRNAFSKRLLTSFLENLMWKICDLSNVFR